MSRLVATCVLVTAAFAGCGDPQHPTTPARVVSTAAAKTTHAGTVRLADKLTGTLNGNSLGEGAVTALADARRQRAAVAFDLTPLAKAAGARPRSLRGMVVYLGPDAFLTDGAITSRLPSGRRWIEVTRGQAEQASGRLAAVGLIDVTKPVDHLRAAIGTTERVGTDTVNGARTTHYRTQVDYRLYVPLVPRNRRAAVARAVSRIESSYGATRFPVDVWIGPDGTIRRAEGAIEGRGLKLEYTLDLTAIGRPVQIIQPPRIRVLDARKP
jgi:hypothetical protein